MKLFAAIGVFVVTLPALLGLVLLATMWQAWWLYPAWAWVFVPLGLRPISFWHFTALMFFFRMMMHHVDTKKDDRETNWVTMLVLFLWPMAVWLMLRWMVAR